MSQENNQLLIIDVMGQVLASCDKQIIVRLNPYNPTEYPLHLSTVRLDDGRHYSDWTNTDIKNSKGVLVTGNRQTISLVKRMR